MSDEITPALTAEEWAKRWVYAHEEENDGQQVHVAANDADTLVVSGYGNNHGAFSGPSLKHAMAALCLHGQPFGFTHEDVEDLREHANLVRSFWGVKMPGVVCIETPGGPRDVFASVITLCDSLADRIAALLPPLS